MNASPSTSRRLTITRVQLDGQLMNAVRQRFADAEIAAPAPTGGVH